MYRVHVKWDMIGHRRRVGDRLLPKRYEMLFEPDADEPRPGLRLVFEVLDGVPQCRELHMVASDHGREVRRADLDVAIEDHLEWASLTVAQPAKGSRNEEGKLVMTLDPAGLDSFRRTVQHARRTTRRRGPSDAELTEAAQVYRSADHAPTQAVAEHFDIAHRTASLWIKRAREKGFL